jgi:hypothetical protein
MRMIYVAHPFGGERMHGRLCNGGRIPQDMEPPGGGLKEGKL